MKPHILTFTLGGGGLNLEKLLRFLLTVKTICLLSAEKKCNEHLNKEQATFF